MLRQRDWALAGGPHCGGDGAPSRTDRTAGTAVPGSLRCRTGGLIAEFFKLRVGPDALSNGRQLKLETYYSQLAFCVSPFSRAKLAAVPTRGCMFDPRVSYAYSVLERAGQVPGGHVDGTPSLRAKGAWPHHCLTWRLLYTN